MVSSFFGIAKGTALSDEDILVTHDDQLKAGHDRLFSDNGGFEGSEQLLDQSQYYYKEIYLTMGQKADVAYPLDDIHDKQSRNTTESNERKRTTLDWSS